MPPETGTKSRLLIVDDEPTNIHILSNILSERLRDPRRQRRSAGH